MSNTEKKKVVISDKTHKKHYLKHRGLKSVIALGDNKMVVTSFGKKNDAELKYLVEKEKLTPFGNENSPKISMKGGVTENQINFDCKDVKNGIAPVTRPDVYSNKELRKDLLGIKDKLEMQFFGKTFNDNLHVQIAYNLLDIQKIFGLHVGNVVNAVLQLVAHYYKKQERKNEIIGMTNSEKLYDEYYNDKNQRDHLIKDIRSLFAYNRYFDGVFKNYDSKNKNNESSNRFNFYIIQILSYLRQFSEHTEMGNTVNLEKFFNPEFVQKKDKENKNKIAVAQEIFNADKDKIIKDFKNNSSKNISILKETLPKEKNLVEKYIDYMFSENNIKNLGLNIRKIREGVVNGWEIDFSEKRKVNISVDFYLWCYFVYHRPGKKTDIIDSLRACCTAEDKEGIYAKLISQFKGDDNIRKISGNVKKIIKEKNIPELKSDEKNLFEEKLNGYIKLDSVISKFVYIMTKFMEKKDINELLTSIINKLSNIKSLMKVGTKLNIWEEGKLFTENFEPLENIDKFLKDFNVVLKMGLLKNNLKKDAVVLGENSSNKVGKQLYKDSLEIFLGENVKDDNEILELCIGDKSSLDKKEPEKKKKDSRDKKVRNFIISSVINNRRFIYLLKTLDTRYCKKIIDNESLVKFILMREDMPDSIIVSYYQKIAKTDQKSSRDQMVDVIYEALKKVSINTFKEEGGLLKKDDKGFGTTDKNLQGELIKNKELITLYLTICYLFARGMSHTNSIYMMAWSSLERDLYYRNDLKKDNNSGETEEEKILGQDYTALSDDTIEKMNSWLQEQEEKFKKAKLKGVQDLKAQKKELNQRSYKKKKHDYDCLKIDFDECHKLLDYERPVLEKRYDAKEKKKPVPNILRKLRNCIAHFNILDECFKNDRLKNIKMNYSNKDGIMNSYFGIYNYVLQQKFIEDFEKPDFNISEKLDYPFKGHKESLLNGGYDKNLLKIMYYPFAYILAKYKNLTIEDLFNDKYPIK